MKLTIVKATLLSLSIAALLAGGSSLSGTAEGSQNNYLGQTAAESGNRADEYDISPLSDVEEVNSF